MPGANMSAKTISGFLGTRISATFMARIIGGTMHHSNDHKKPGRGHTDQKEDPH